MKKNRLFVFEVAYLVILVACDDAIENDNGTELKCAEGMNPDGNGCKLSCRNGWHAGPGGECLADCPPMMATQADGICALSCAEDEFPSETTVTTQTDALLTHYCNRGCPQNMLLVDGQCEMPCGEGWTQGFDGKCHLNCPEGMTATTDGPGCAFITVGESKICPADTWDTTLAGPSPLFVDPATGSEAGDGTQGLPFATINQALGAMGDEGTIYLAPGIYDEQVIVDGKKEFNLIGQCAANVLIAPSTMVETYPEGDGGKSAGVITTWTVDRVRIHGIRAQSPGKDAIDIRHDPSAESPETVQIDQVVVDGAGLSGILVRGAYDQTTVSDSTLTQGQFGIDIVIQSDDEDVLAGNILPSGAVDIQRNLIDGLDLFDETWNVIGVNVIGADAVTVSGNYVGNMAHAVGMNLNLLNAVVVDGNILSNITGYGAIKLIGTMQQTTPMAVTIRGNVIHKIFAGPCSWDNTCPDIAYGIDFDTVKSEGPFQATLARNRIELVQGHAVTLSLDEIPGDVLDISESEFIASSNAIDWGSGDVSIRGCRFTRVWRAISGGSVKGYLPSGAMLLEGNLFEDREEDPAGMPEKYKTEMLGALVYLTYQESNSDIRVIGNLFRNNKEFSMDIDEFLFVLNLTGDNLLVESNVFTSNEGAATYVLNGTLTARNNTYMDNDIGLAVVQAPGQWVAAADVRENFFMSNPVGLFETWKEKTGVYTVEDNVFLNTAVVTGDLASMGLSAEQLQIKNNYFGAVLMQAGSADSLLVGDNLFEESRLAVIGQNEEGSAEIAGNIFDRSHLEVYRADSTVRIENNEFNGPDKLFYLGAGIGVYESPGPVQIIHNLIGDYAKTNVPGIGVMGDGIQVVGSPIGKTSDVWIESNRIKSNGRYGVVMVSAMGRVDGNMYLKNGGDGTADVVLYAPQGTGYQGGDVGFGATPKTPPLTVASENLLTMLR